MNEYQNDQLRAVIRGLNELILSGIRDRYIIEADFMVNSFADTVLPERVDTRGHQR